MFWFNRKRIKQLEKRIAILELQLDLDSKEIGELKEALEKLTRRERIAMNCTHHSPVVEHILQAHDKIKSRTFTASIRWGEHLDQKTKH